MAKFDEIYSKCIEDILQNGVMQNENDHVRAKWEDGTPAYTKSIISTQIKMDNSEVPLLTKKKMFPITAAKEMLIFFQKQTNSVKEMQSQGVNIWNEWEKEDGTIGPAYGYQNSIACRKVKITDELSDMILSKQIGPNSKPDKKEGYYLLTQVDYLLYQLKVNPTSRRLITSFWNIRDLDDMALEPCVWNTQWLVRDNKLHLIVGQRSGDLGLGIPFNVFQYYLLQRMIAQVSDLELGTLTFNVNDLHIYDRHIEPMTSLLTKESFEAATLHLNPNVKSFYDFTISDINIRNYVSNEKVDMEVAI